MINDIEMRNCKAPTNLGEIESFEEFIGAKLPSDYKQFLLKHNGGHPICDACRLIEPINELNLEIGIGWFYALYDGEVSNIIKGYKYSRGKIPDNLLPISYDDGEICIGLNGDEYNKIYYWPTNWSVFTEEEMSYVYLIANSFAEFINGLYESDIDGADRVRTYQDGTVTVNEVITPRSESK